MEASTSKGTLHPKNIGNDMNFQFVIAARKKIIPKQNLPEFLHHIALLLFYLRPWVGMACYCFIIEPFIDNRQ